MKIVITGTTSMIGAALCRELIERGHDVIAIVRTGCSKLSVLPVSEHLRIIALDMEEYGSMSEVLRESVDAAVLLAWDGTRGHARNEERIQKANYLNSMRAVKELCELGCRTILTAGSQAEYGPWHSKECQTEDSDANPNTAYGIYKLKFYKDAYCLCERRNIKVIEPRFFSIYGPDDHEETLVLSMLKNMVRNMPCRLTECKQMWDFLYISDAVAGLIILLEHECPGGIYNFGSGDVRQLKEYVEEMHRITESTSELQYGVLPYPETGMVSIRPSVDKLKAMGWQPEVSFEEGINRILQQKKLCIEERI